MKKFLITILLALSCIWTNAQTTSFITTTNLNLRNEANLNSSVLDVIPKGAEVTVLGANNDAWSLVVFNGKIGWARSIYITRSLDNNPSSTVTYYTNRSGQRVQSPTYYPTAPKGATARCKDGTYSFSTSRRGTCSHHGGVAEWLN